MRNVENVVYVEGYLYDHNLEVKTTGPQSKNPGTTYIRGQISIATDQECYNVVKVNYTYVTPVWATSGKENKNYAVLQDIIDGKYGTVMANGIESAALFRITNAAIELNEWYDAEKGNFVSNKRISGGFIGLINKFKEADESKRRTFTADMLITGTRRIEEDEEKGTPEKVIVKGAVFSFNKSLLPVEFSVTKAEGMDYFEGLEPSGKKPVFTKVWGRIESHTVVKKIEQESEWGETAVKETTQSFKDYIITGSAADTYEWDDEGSILASELTELLEKREIHKAELKSIGEELKAKKNSPASSGIANSLSEVSSDNEGEYDFDNF